MPKLYIVGTPVGNLKDITLRALETLENVDYIACEDTRHSSILLNEYEIKKPTFSLQKFNEKKTSQKVISLLKSGKNVAYISDAGMPCISDPGFILIQEVQKEQLEVEIIPGVSAVITAMVGSNLPSEKFAFLGFLPEQNSDKEKLLSNYKNVDATLIFYVSSHNLQKDLDVLHKNLGSRNVVIANELTKKFEKYIAGKLGEICVETPKGEYVVLVEGVTPTSPLNELSLEEHLKFYTSQGLEKMEAIKQVAKDRKQAKSEIYKYFMR